jgi:hypothetical protein
VSAIALGATRDDRAVAPLRTSLNDPDPLQYGVDKVRDLYGIDPHCRYLSNGG